MERKKKEAKNPEGKEMGVFHTFLQTPALEWWLMLANCSDFSVAGCQQ